MGLGGAKGHPLSERQISTVSDYALKIADGGGRGRKKRIKDAVEGRGRYAPWKKPNLSRWRRVVVFCEDLLVTSGKDAGKKLELRKWQKEFIRAIYAVDKQGVRQVRTAGET